MMLTSESVNVRRRFAPRSTDTAYAPEGARLAQLVEMTDDDYLIPIDRYISQEFHDLEMDKLWANVWQMTCRANDIPNAGDYYEYKLGHRSYLIVRGDDGEVRAFNNACAHRSMKIASGQGNAPGELKCMFHAWRYNLDGSLKAITDRETFCELKDEDYGLIGVQADIWGGWVFIHPNPENTQTLRDYLGDLVPLEEMYQLADLVPIGLNLTTPVSANWKVGVEGFLENYHIHAIHPQCSPMFNDYDVPTKPLGDHSMFVVRLGTPSPRLGPEETVDPMEVLSLLFGELDDDTEVLRDINDPLAKSKGGGSDYFNTALVSNNPLAYFRQYRDEDGEIDLPEGVTVRSVLVDFYRDSAARKGVNFKFEDDSQWTDVWQYHIFPNVVINIGASGVLFHRFYPNPDSPHASEWNLVTLDWVTDPSKIDEVRTPATWLAEGSQSLGLLLDQDVAQMPLCQQGLRSAGKEYSTLSKQESRISTFHHTLTRKLGLDG